MVRFYIECGEHLITACGHTTKDSVGIDHYLKCFGFSSAETAAEWARDFGLTDIRIRYIKFEK